MLHVRRGGRTRPVPKGIVYGKPKNQGITQIKFHRNKRSVAEECAGRKWVVSKFSTLTGSMRTLPTNTSRSFLWMLRIMLSGMTQESTMFTSIGNFV
ncbi:hypothetical protein MKW92_021217, partial [Papaver armeniacum]